MDKLKSGYNNLSNIKKILLLTIVIIFIILLINIFTSFSKYTNVIDHLTNEDVEEITLSPGKLNITLYYVDWCGYSQQFIEQSWIRLLEKFKNDSMVELHELNCTNIKTTIKTPKGNNIVGFPTIIFNYIDNENDYKGSRDFEEISNYITNMTNELKNI